MEGKDREERVRRTLAYKGLLQRNGSEYWIGLRR
jgi:hypothetical protein